MIPYRGKRPTAWCPICGRKDAPRKEGKAALALQFHYSPPPCSLPCVGGPISSEERTYHPGVHSRHCRCGLGAAA